MRKGFFVGLIVLWSLVFTACGNCESASVDYVLLEKIQTPPTTGVCVKIGELWLPTNGGSCVGMLESVPEKFYFLWGSDDGDRKVEVSPSEYFSRSVGDKKIEEKMVCK